MPLPYSLPTKMDPISYEILTNSNFDYSTRQLDPVWWDECFRLLRKAVKFQSKERRYTFEKKVNDLNTTWNNVLSSHWKVNLENYFINQVKELEEEIDREFVFEKLES